MAQAFDIARNDLIRAFLFEGGMYRCCDKPFYFPCLSVDGLTQDRGDVTKVECPDPFNFGKFIEVGTVPGELSRMTSTISTHMSRTEASELYRLFNSGCSFDLQLHLGLCDNPTNFNTYDKVLVFCDVQVTSFSTDALVALQSGDRATIMENVDISVSQFYEIVPLQYNEKAAQLTPDTGPLIDVLIADRVMCGGICGAGSDGCQRLFTVDNAGDLLYTSDSGLEWTQFGTNWNSTPAGVLAGIDALGSYVWSYTNTGEIVYATADMVLADGGLGTSTPDLVTGLVTTGVDQDAGNQYGVIVGTGGIIMTVLSPDCGIEDTFTSITTENLIDVNVNHNDFILIGGENGTVIWSDDAESWSVAQTAPTADNITAVYAKNHENWLVGDDAGNLWCTDDCGVTWEQVKMPGTQTRINDIEFSTAALGWIATPLGLYKSIDGGCTWVLTPEGSKKSGPLAGGANLLDIAPCLTDPNFIVGVGADAATGFVLRGAN